MNVFDFFGSAVCHQMAERSFSGGAVKAPSVPAVQPLKAVSYWV